MNTSVRCQDASVFLMNVEWKKEKEKYIRGVQGDLENQDFQLGRDHPIKTQT